MSTSNWSVRSRRFAFTINNPDENDINTVKMLKDLPTVTYLVSELEHTGEDEGTTHVQGYVEFKNPTTRQRLFRLLNSKAHIEEAKGDRISNYIYCTKEEKEDPGNHLIVYKADESQQQSMNRKMQARLARAARDEERLLKDRMIIHDIQHMSEEAFIYNHPSYYKNRYSTYKKIRGDHMRRTMNKTWDGDLQYKNLWIYGPTRTGKTRIASSNIDPNAIYYLIAKSKWFDGFDQEQHKRIIIDDYPSFKDGGREMIELLKRWSDRYSYPAEFKGGVTIISPTFPFIVTSNHSLLECVCDHVQGTGEDNYFIDEDYNALASRFTEIYYDKGLDAIYNHSILDLIEGQHGKDVKKYWVEHGWAIEEGTPEHIPEEVYNDYY